MRAHDRRTTAAADQRHGSARHARRALVALLAALALALALVCWAPAGPFRAAVPLASAHAILVRSDPAADTVLRSPPSRVRLWFSEDLNKNSSSALVVDAANRRVDTHDLEFPRSDPREMAVSLPLLPAGVYVVAWKTQSAEDGHVTSGSFLFRVARPDGSIPPLPARLPTGNTPGTGGAGNSGGVDGPTLLGGAGTWLALLLLTFWLGGMIWETWIAPPLPASEAPLALAARAAATRFRALLPGALLALLAANLLVVLSLGAQLAGDWSGLFSLTWLSGIVFGSRFGAFWWLRQAGALAALLLAWWLARRDPLWRYRADVAEDPAPAPEPERLGAWPAWLLATTRHTPRALVAGLRRRTIWGRVELALGAVTLVAFAFSGHAAAVASNELAYAVSVDLLHLAGDAIWVGGLFYIAFVLVPALGQLPAGVRGAVLARGLPRFSALAVVTVVVLAATGSLNATIHLTSISQFLTTAYGRTLAIKIELFLIMAAISYYHAFRLRPRLARALAVEASPALERPLALAEGAARATTGHGAALAERGANGHGAAAGGGTVAGSLSLPAARLADTLEDWLRREAVLGAAILLCVALLGVFAGTLAPAAAAPTGPAPVAHTFNQTQTVGGLTSTLVIAPATFGSNTFTVTLLDAKGQPLTGAGVELLTQSLDMDMGVQTTQLQPGSAPGVYAGTADLTMAGHWQISVRVLPADTQQFTKFDYQLTATY
ncbi:MAG TPA: copper resistance protein CopC [Ktedonobacterales bacterium]|nr:copper resistance protein CopC [Ktedonobacterales bacterium]